MTPLAWDQVGDRTYQTGVDHGVLYLPDGAVVWNGLTSVEERFSHERKTFFQNGVKYLEHIVPSDFSAQLKAFTYPDEFDQVLGILSDGEGMYVHDQRPLNFGLSYRTLKGDDIEGTDRGYLIHLLYNLNVVPDSTAYTSLKASPVPTEFGWSLSGIPVAVAGYRPTVHITLDSTEMDVMLFTEFELMLYGRTDVPAYLPSFQEVVDFIAAWDVTITDNEDGTWTASGPNRLVSLLDSTTFQIIDEDAIYLNPETYTISSP